MGVIASGPYTSTGRFASFSSSATRPQNLRSRLTTLAQMSAYWSRSLLRVWKMSSFAPAQTHRGADFGRDHALRAAGLRAEHDDGVGIVQLRHAVRAAVAVGAQGGFVLGDEHPDALEFLQRGDGFVVQARRNEHGFLGGLGLFGGLPHGLEGFVPGGRLQFSVAADQRLQDALARFGPGFVTAAHAQVSAG